MLDAMDNRPWEAWEALPQNARPIYDVRDSADTSSVEEGGDAERTRNGTTTRCAADTSSGEERRNDE